MSKNALFVFYFNSLLQVVFPITDILLLLRW